MSENAATSYNPHHEIAELSPFQTAVNDVQKQYASSEGFEGFGKGKTTDGQDAIIVFVRDNEALSKLASNVGGFPVIGQITGEVKILPVVEVAVPAESVDPTG